MTLTSFGVDTMITLTLRLFCTFYLAIACSFTVTDLSLSVTVQDIHKSLLEMADYL